MVLLFLTTLFTSCTTPEKQISKDTLFELHNAHSIGIDFKNELTYLNDFNIFTYRNFYNGGGVAIGDVNNDGLPDIYFSSNMNANKLYLNLGNFKFKDITDSSGVGGTRKWSTAVTMVDINGDQWLDIYVCNSGNMEDDDRKNELFINNHNGTFSEMAHSYGLDDKGFSSGASFFDFDRDGDLDLYLVNNSFISTNSNNYQQSNRKTRDPLGGDKLYKNIGDQFVDVSLEANIFGSVIGFGLGAITSDLNRDGWPDIYVCNDFFERDYIYMNNGDGTFNEELPSQMQSINQASMGVDAADINGDGYPEIFVTEMLPKSDDRFKTTMIYEDWESYMANLNNDYYHQFTRNTLQLNNQEIIPGSLSFSEIGRFCGVEATDWSWSGLMVDLDNNGFKDIYVTNGIYQDILDQNFLKKISNDLLFRDLITNQSINYQKLIEAIPSNPISNFIFSGKGNYQFSDSTTTWGLDQPSFSNGAAYGDLDNDGDLDLVVNNIESSPFIYENKSNERHGENNYLKLKLLGINKNSMGIGSTVQCFANGHLYQVEQISSRGFQSSMDQALIIGLGLNKRIDSLKVLWPTGKVNTLFNVETNRTLEINEFTAEPPPSFKKKNKGCFVKVENESLREIHHLESQYNDFNDAALLFHMSSTEGAGTAVMDVNDDGLEDVFLCGSKGFPGQLLIQSQDGLFHNTNQDLFEFDKYNEDIKAVFFDVDGDLDQDLIVASGSPEYLPYSARLLDRLYKNDGLGKFQKSAFLSSEIPPENTSVIAPCDFDHDGDKDLFIGIRSENGNYGVPQNGYILQNDGTGFFIMGNKEFTDELKAIGLIKDARWIDYDNDGWEDLLVAGEWMAIHLFKNNEGKQFKNVTEISGLSNYEGWWNCLEIGDIDHDGDVDFIAGNHGLNSRFKITADNLISMFVKDFDNNGVVEQIICKKKGSQHIPYAQADDILKQLPGLKSKFDKLESMSFTIEDLFSKSELEDAQYLEVNFLASAIFVNDGSGQFISRELPIEAQFSPIYSIYLEDMNKDSIPDILAGGNLYEAKPEVGRYDASYGIYLEGTSNGYFKTVPNYTSGLEIIGQIRDIKKITIQKVPYYLISTINGPLETYQWKGYKE